MRLLKLLGAPTACVLSLGIAQPVEAACEPVGEIQFICDVISPEDFAIIPGAEWIIASGDQEGGWTDPDRQCTEQDRDAAVPDRQTHRAA